MSWMIAKNPFSHFSEHNSHIGQLPNHPHTELPLPSTQHSVKYEKAYSATTEGLKQYTYGVLQSQYNEAIEDLVNPFLTTPKKYSYQTTPTSAAPPSYEEAQITTSTPIPPVRYTSTPPPPVKYTFGVLNNVESVQTTTVKPKKKLTFSFNTAAYENQNEVTKPPSLG